MRGALVLIGIVLVYGSVLWLRRPGAGGRVGEAVRRSDRDSAQMYVDDLRAKANAIEREYLR